MLGLDILGIYWGATPSITLKHLIGYPKLCRDHQNTKKSRMSGKGPKVFFVGAGQMFVVFGGATLSITQKHLKGYPNYVEIPKIQKRAGM